MDFFALVVDFVPGIRIDDIPFGQIEKRERPLKAGYFARFIVAGQPAAYLNAERLSTVGVCCALLSIQIRKNLRVDCP